MEEHDGVPTVGQIHPGVREHSLDHRRSARDLLREDAASSETIRDQASAGFKTTDAGPKECDLVIIEAGPCAAEGHEGWMRESRELSALRFKRRDYPQLRSRKRGGARSGKPRAPVGYPRRLAGSGTRLRDRGWNADLGDDLLKRSFKPILVQAGITRPVRFHDLRHSSATLLLTMGVPLTVVASVLGHSTTRVTERYAAVVPELARQAAAAMDRALLERTPR